MLSKKFNWRRMWWADILVVIIRQMYIPGRTESDVVQEI